MHTEPEIVAPLVTNTRAYVKVYIDGVRHRFYNGSCIGLNLHPNRCKTLKERDRALSKLCFSLRKKLEAGWTPAETQKTKVYADSHAGVVIAKAIEEMKSQDLSALYKRDVSQVGATFTLYITAIGLVREPIEEITPYVIEDFLHQFNSSATNYMNKRRTLGGIFSRLVRNGVISTNPVSKTTRQKEKSLLHEAFTHETLKAVLQHLEKEHPCLYLCALVMYGCLLRPHQEIRMLTRKHLNEDCTKITLSGDSNKSGRVRTVFVPEYVRSELLKRGIPQFKDSWNIFTKSDVPYNESYFNTAWSRVKEALVKAGVISNEQTLYSFRHTAAINVYMKTKDLYKVQQAMGHSSMTVTLTYMRSLGLMNAVSLDDAPEL